MVNINYENLIKSRKVKNVTIQELRIRIKLLKEKAELKNDNSRN